MKKIIVPVDFTPYSEYALSTAAQLAKKYDAEILALHMLEISDNLLINTDNEQNAKAVFFLKLAEQQFEKFLDKNYLKGITVTPIVKHFKVFSEVSEVANEHNADLIVMGSHGSSGWSEFFIGSNTEKVVRHSDVPVLIIKRNSAILDFKNVVFACDFSEDLIKSYKRILKLFKELDATLHLIYVNLPNASFSSSTEMEKRVDEFLSKTNGNSDSKIQIHYVCDYTVEKGILNFAKKMNADLIAIPTHGRKGLAHFFEGSISEDLANHAKLPVMTFKI